MMNLGSNKRRKLEKNGGVKEGDDEEDNKVVRPTSPLRNKKSAESARKQTERKFLPEGFQPGPWDVICQRGGENVTHVGNQRFRLVVEQYLGGYKQTATKQAKSEIVSRIVATIRDKVGPIGGFIKKDLLLGRWYEIGGKLARDKVGQALRDGVNRSDAAVLLPAETLQNFNSTSHSLAGSLGNQGGTGYHEERTSSNIYSKLHHPHDMLLSSTTRIDGEEQEKSKLEMKCRERVDIQELAVGALPNEVDQIFPQCQQNISSSDLQTSSCQPDSNITMNTEFFSSQQPFLNSNSNEQQVAGEGLYCTPDFCRRNFAGIGPLLDHSGSATTFQDPPLPSSVEHERRSGEGENQHQRCLEMTPSQQEVSTRTARITGITNERATATYPPSNSFVQQWSESDLTPNPVVYPPGSAATSNINTNAVLPFSDDSSASIGEKANQKRSD